MSTNWSTFAWNKVLNFWLLKALLGLKGKNIARPKSGKFLSCKLWLCATKQFFQSEICLSFLNFALCRIKFYHPGVIQQDSSLFFTFDTTDCSDDKIFTYAKLSKYTCVVTHGLRTPRESFLSKIQNFWAWADKLGWKFMRYLGYLWPNYKHHFGTVSPLTMGKCSWFSFLQKTLVFRPKTYNSQILPK